MIGQRVYKLSRLECLYNGIDIWVVCFLFSLWALSMCLYLFNVTSLSFSLGEAEGKRSVPCTMYFLCV